jgi:uncharacterized RDD family membrane protein YckC
LLYGQKVCKKCVNAFANRRQFAFLIDMVVIRLSIFIITAAIGFFVVFVFATSQREVDESTMSFLFGIDLLFTLVGMFLIAAKDGLSGYSPGKALLGVRVVHADTLRPIDLMTSVKRNWPVLIPIMPLVIAVQMMKGRRAGDGLAGTRVIWNRYADNPVFTGRPSGYAAVSPEDYSMPVPLRPHSDNPYEPPIA